MESSDSFKSSYSEQRLAGLKAHTVSQKQKTVERLRVAIEALKEQRKPITVHTIREISGLDYTTYARNPEALALFRANSAHLTKKRKRGRKGTESSLPRDPLLHYKKSQLADRLRQAERRIKELEMHNSQLVQQQVESDLKNAQLLAEVAEFRVFLERFRADLQHGEHGS